MPGEQLAAFESFRDKADAWIFVAGGWPDKEQRLGCKAQVWANARCGWGGLGAGWDSFADPGPRRTAMSSQFNSFLASSHRADLRRSAERSRAAEAARQEGGDAGTGPEAGGFPTLLRSRRLGRLVRVLPPAGRHSA
jgi:hypothetical protein